MAKISIIVPVYNVEMYLEQCIDSILSQTFTDFELILVNDGSTDRSPKICDFYLEKDDRIIVIHQENKGASDARNVGLDYVFQYSESEYIMFVDSDDTIAPVMLEYLYRAIIDNNVLLSSCAYMRPVDKQYVKEPIYRVHVETVEDAYKRSTVNCIAVWGKLYDKTLWQNVRFALGEVHEDVFTTWKAIFLTDRVANVGCVLYYYTNNPNGITNSPWTTKKLILLKLFVSSWNFLRKINYFVHIDIVLYII